MIRRPLGFAERARRRSIGEFDFVMWECLNDRVDYLKMVHPDASDYYHRLLKRFGEYMTFELKKESMCDLLWFAQHEYSVGRSPWLTAHLELVDENIVLQSRLQIPISSTLVLSYLHRLLEEHVNDTNLNNIIVGYLLSDQEENSPWFKCENRTNIICHSKTWMERLLGI